MNIKKILSNFKIKGDIISYERHGNGHINKTYVVLSKEESGKEHRYIFQIVNNGIFTNVDILMNNILKVTSFLKEKIKSIGGDYHRETMNIILTKDEKPYLYDKECDSFCRMFLFVENSICIDKVESESDFVKVASSFGRFLNLLSDFPSSTLEEVIPNFHNTHDRYLKFIEALKVDAYDRSKLISKEIDFVLKREKDTSHLIDLLNSNKLPLRVTHNDTKLNNILLDKDTKEGICIIDLDTVMPGLVMYDYGDSIRFGANNCEEDEKDLSKVNFSIPLFEAFTKGYLEVTKNSLTQTEKDNLVWGAKLMTLECGIRFLTDYLSGDTYFKTTRDNQNLDRARTQFKLVEDMENNWDELNNIVKKYS